MTKPKILLVDNNEAFLELFCCMPEADAFEILTHDSASAALEQIQKTPVDVVISDEKMPEMNGTDLLTRIQDMYPEIPFILITAYGTSEDAIAAIKQGAFHYFEKPIDTKLDLLWSTVRKAVEKRRLHEKVESLYKEKNLCSRVSSAIIGESEAIKTVIDAVEKVAELPVPILIYGETGTGKELVAKTIHEQSQRQPNGFFAVNCSEFAPGVLESELFGHEKGAFTGAIQQKKGLFELADGGTLFLDELSNAPLPLQSKLLRVIETKHFKRVGGNATISSDFRLIAATNSALEEEIEQGRFRQDLYYRLNVYPINIPPLRQRKADIPLIAEYYFNRFRLAYHRRIDGLSERAMATLQAYDWPGNVRELVNVIERAVITCGQPMITNQDLPFASQGMPEVSSLNLKEMERYFIQAALKQTNHNKTRAAKELGISRKTLIEKVRRYNLDDGTPSA